MSQAEQLIETYMASKGAHVGSSGFTNYMSSDVPAALEKVFRDNPKAIVVDGTDDWYAPVLARPETFARQKHVKTSTKFHSGVSGISSSGVVFDDESAFKKFHAAFTRASKNPSLTRRPKSNVAGAGRKPSKTSYHLRIYRINGKSELSFVSDGYTAAIRKADRTKVLDIVKPFGGKMRRMDPSGRVTFYFKTEQEASDAFEAIPSMMTYRSAYLSGREIRFS